MNERYMQRSGNEAQDKIASVLYTNMHMTGMGGDNGA